MLGAFKNHLMWRGGAGPTKKSRFLNLLNWFNTLPWGLILGGILPLLGLVVPWFVVTIVPVMAAVTSTLKLKMLC
jgi:hypothetical protein